MPTLNPNLFLALFVALQIADAATTLKALKLPGAQEGNPVMRALFKALGVGGGLLVMKLALVALFWAAPMVAPLGQWILIAVYVLIVANNLRVMRKLKKAKVAV